MKSSFLASIFFSISFFAFSQKGKVIIPDGHSLNVPTVVLSNDKKFLFTAEQGKCIMWDIKTKKQMHSFPCAGTEFSLSADGSKLLLPYNNKFNLYSTIDGRLLASKNPDEIEKYISYFGHSFSESGEYIYIAYSNGIAVLNASTLSIVKRVRYSFDSYSHFYLAKGNIGVITYRNYIQTVDLNTFSAVQKFEFPKSDGDGSFSQVQFLKGPNLVVATNTYGAYYFYSITNGQNAGKIDSRARDANIVPGFNTNQVIIIAENNKGELAYEIWDTKTFRRTYQSSFSHFTNFKGITAGVYDAVSDQLYFTNYNKVCYSSAKTISKADKFLKLAADLGMDVFDPIRLYAGQQRLNLVTDDSVAKSIDLARMVSMYHRPIKGRFSALAASPTGDTVAIFDYENYTIKNLATGKTISPTKNVKTEFLQREAFFFSDDGKKMYYLTGSKLMEQNLATNSTRQVIDVGNFYNGVFSSDNSIVAYAQSKDRVVAFDVATGKELINMLITQPNGSDDIHIKISPDNTKLLVAHKKYKAVYDLKSKSVLAKNEEYNILYSENCLNANSDFSQVVIGDRWGKLHVFNNQLKEIKEIKAHDNIIRRVYFSSDDKLMYTVSNDNTIKVFRAASGEIIGTLYLFNKGNDYVFVGPDGRFDGTEGGMKEMYYLKGREFISLDKVAEKYYTPNLYQRLLAGEIFEPIPDLELKPKPRTKIVYAEKKRNLEVDDDKPVYTNSTGIAEITVQATAPEDKVDEIRLFHNGKVITLATRGMFVTDNDGSDSKKYTINLLPGINTFRAVALNSQRTESDADEIMVNYAANGSQPLAKSNNNTPGVVPIDPVDKNATMYLMVVGINAYKNKISQLTYALPDATAFKNEIEKDAKSMLANVKTYFISDAKADKAGIINAFADITQNAKPQDVFVFYYAGHGYIHPTNKEFYLVSADVSDGGESLLKNGVPAKELQQYAVEIQAQKQLFILDACQSAGAFEKMLQHDGEQQKSLALVARSTGTHWMAASGSTETAKEFAQLGHGVFTYVLLQALKGQAATNKMITVNGLKNFLQVQVPELVKKYGGNSQYPASYGFGNDFPVEVLK